MNFRNRAALIERVPELDARGLEAWLVRFPGESDLCVQLVTP